MTMASAGRRLRDMGMLLAFVMSLNVVAHSQGTRLDVSSCFSPLMVTHESHTSETNYEWYYLAMIDEGSFNQIKADTQASALLPAGWFTGNFAYFNEQRQHYFEMHNENIKFYQATADNVSSLPPSWQPTIQKCITDTINASGKGLFYLPINSTAERFRLEIKYKSTERYYLGPWVQSSEIIGGYVQEPNGNHRKSLYGECAISWLSVTCPNVNSTNEFTVIRDDPNKPVSITLNLSNKEYSTSFDVDIEPKKINCVKTYEGSKPQTITLPEIPVSRTEISYGSGGYEATVWTARFIAPGKVTNIDFRFPDARDMHLLRMDEPSQREKAQSVAKLIYNVDITRDPDWQDDVIIFVGTQKGGDVKTIVATPEYKLQTSSCSEIDWK